MSTPLPSRLRLDQALVARGLVPSREQAQRAILAGHVRVNQQVARKPSDRVRPEDDVSLAVQERYVSRGGLKLEHALRYFHLAVTGWSALDVGASTGGFTDCLLQHGAAQVYAVDVGRGQLAWKLRRDPRVVVMEGVNARYLGLASFPAGFSGADLAVIDCAFISLRQLFGPVTACLRSPSLVIALIKPQFEAGKAEVDRGGGVITDPAVHRRVIEELQEFVRGQTGLCWRDLTESPILGPAGNREFLALLEKPR